MPRTTRWCPTPEQLMILEELYRGGLRTPKAPLIQKITTHLSLYGKIEGKNVFYWFQNHKARDKQKLRRKMSMQLLQQHIFQPQPFLFQQQFPIRNFPSPPLFPPTFHQLPSHGSSAMIDEGMVVEVPSRRSITDNILKLDYEESNMSKSYCRDWMTTTTVDNNNNNNNILSMSCNANNRPPLKTLDLFPTTSTSLKEQIKLRAIT